MPNFLLAGLPSEVWSSLITFLHPRETFRLFLTGDRLLTFTLLNRGAITTLSITFKRHGPSLTSFITTQGYLRSLELEFCDRATPSPFCPSLILSLPPTLTSISLTCSNAESAWLDDSSGSSRRVIDYSNAMPLLTSISLDGESSWSDDSLSWLPTNITELKLWKNTELTNAGVRQLPRTLVTLFLPCYDSLWQRNLASSLPSDLESLYINFKSRHSFEDALYLEEYGDHRPEVHLLSSLRQLKRLKILHVSGNSFPGVPFLGNCMVIQNGKGKLLRSFPPSSDDDFALTHLSIQYMCSEMKLRMMLGSGMPLWPRSLTSLSIMTGRSIFEELEEALLLLPVGLSHFSMGYVQNAVLSGNPFMKFDAILPRDYATSCIPLSFTLVATLPRHLVTLDLSLSLYFLKRQDFSTCFASLPPSLSFLQLSQLCEAGKEGEMAILEAEEIEALPRGLRTISMHRIRFASTSLSSLPPSLARLYLYSIVLQDDALAAFEAWNLHHGPKPLSEISLKESALASLSPSVMDSHLLNFETLLSEESAKKLIPASLSV